MDDDLIYNSKHKLRPSYKKQKFSLSSTNFNNIGKASGRERV